MYEMADQSWRGRPVRMTRAVLDATAARIAEHAAAHQLSSVKVILHGGEPLLAGPELISYAVTAIRDAVADRTQARFIIQTNAVGLDEIFLRLFHELDIQVGVSLDGDAAGHDRHRMRRNGQGSYAEVSAGLRRLTSDKYRHLFGGLLATVDITNDPLATYQALLAFQPPLIDFLLPHGNWTTPPPGRSGSAGTPYASWLSTVFDAWYGTPRQPTRVRLFEELIHLLFGGASQTEAVGLSPVAVLVVETDGSIEQVDALKSVYPGAPETGLHVTQHDFDSVLLLPPVVARQIGLRALAAACQACPVRLVCGGGHYAHRYRFGTGYANPSVYCPDLYGLISHIRQALESDIASRRARTS
jgi:uncharacterized protein